MRKLKFIEPIIRIFLLILWSIYFSNIKESTLWILVIPVFTDLLVKYLGYLWIKGQVDNFNIIYFNFKRPLFSKLINIIGTIGMLFFILFIIKSVEIDSIDLNLFGVVFFIYIGIYEILFSNKIDRIYFDEYGIIRSDLTEKGIKWNEMENLNISNDKIEIKSSKSDFSLTTTIKESNKILDFITKNKITVPNIVYV